MILCLDYSLGASLVSHSKQHEWPTINLNSTSCLLPQQTILQPPSQQTYLSLQPCMPTHNKTLNAMGNAATALLQHYKLQQSIASGATEHGTNPPITLDPDDHKNLISFLKVLSLVPLGTAKKLTLLTLMTTNAIDHTPLRLW